MNLKCSLLVKEEDITFHSNTVPAELQHLNLIFPLTLNLLPTLMKLSFPAFCFTSLLLLEFSKSSRTKRSLDSLTRHSRDMCRASLFFSTNLVWKKHECVLRLSSKASLLHLNLSTQFKFFLLFLQVLLLWLVLLLLLLLPRFNVQVEDIRIFKAVNPA